MSWLNAWTFLKGRLVSRTFVVLFAVATNMYMFDVFADAYARNNLSLELQQKIYQVFGHGVIVSIYLAAVIEALGLSVLISFIISKLRKNL
jgi:hypothetical protein